ncbi:MAG: winged helix-turn-helix transcriptional regulator [Candidatus Nanohaloarchaea archaeon]|nr:winged helix-turn-helix transcriptional regulator [Candidatus Nanohaloarchaea archaeon]
MDAAVWEDVAYVQNSVNREKVLQELVAAGRPMTPTELSDDLGIVVKTASRAVRQLDERGLVACRNPDAPRDRRYQPTDQGRRVADRLDAVADRTVPAAPPALGESPLEYGAGRDEPVDDAVSFVAMSENRAAVLNWLHQADIPLTPSELSTDLDISFNSASRAVRQLVERDLVECVTPEAERFRRYTVTDGGETVVAVLHSDASIDGEE